MKTLLTGVLKPAAEKVIVRASSGGSSPWQLQDYESLVRSSMHHFSKIKIIII